MGIEWSPGTLEGEQQKLKRTAVHRSDAATCPRLTCAGEAVVEQIGVGVLSDERRPTVADLRHPLPDDFGGQGLAGR